MKNSGFIIMGEHIYQQAKAARAKATLDTLRPGEPPLGSLAPKEQNWLATAFAYLNQIYEKRGAGRPGKEAFCIFEAGKVYVQFLAPCDAETLMCEAVSTKSVPDIAAFLMTEGDETLRRLGFEPPKISPNYSQTINIKDVADLAFAARLAFRVLKEAYRVADVNSATANGRIPISATTDH